MGLVVAIICKKDYCIMLAQVRIIYIMLNS